MRKAESLGKIYLQPQLTKAALERWKRGFLPMVSLLPWLPATVLIVISNTISSILAQAEKSIGFLKA